jgi:hypothetical protein
MRISLKTWMGKMFSLLFLALSLLLIALAGYQFYAGLAGQKEVVSIFVQSINTAIISLAVFELGIGIGKEYATTEDGENTFQVIRRTIARFVGTVCIALVLESLIMIIKYSQLDLAGNLYYPVGILGGASFLLSSLGLFLNFTRLDSRDRRCRRPIPGSTTISPLGFRRPPDIRAGSMVFDKKSRDHARL